MSKLPIDILQYIDLVYSDDGYRYEVSRAIITNDGVYYICTCLETGDTVLVDEEELVSYLF